MKTIMLCGLLLAGMISLTGCQKKQDEAKPAETPFTSLLTSETDIVTASGSVGSWEQGMIFSPLVAGKITQLGSRMPDPGNYRVTLWDNDTKQILRQKTIAQTAPNTLTMSEIEPLPVAANKKLMISINSQADGVNKKIGIAYKNDESNFLPITKGNIQILSASYRQTATAIYPSQVTNLKDRVYGFPELLFIGD